MNQRKSAKVMNKSIKHLSAQKKLLIINLKVLSHYDVELAKNIASITHPILETVIDKNKKPSI